MFNTCLYFQISIIVTIFVPKWLLLKKKLSDSKTKLEALFSSFRTRSLYFEYIHQSKNTNCKFSTIYSSFSDIDDCESDPCENNATCTDGVNNYTCTCMAGYEGYNCSIGKLDHCPPIPPISREESYIFLKFIPYLSFNYKSNDLHRCQNVFTFFPKRKTYILREQGNILREHFAMFNSYRYFQISIISTIIVPEWLLLKKSLSDSKTKLEALFSSFRTRSLYFEYIHQSSNTKMQIFYHLFLFFRYRRLCL